VRKDLYKHRQNATGFAILYQAAVSDASSAGVNFTVGAGGSSSLHLSVEASIRLGKKDASRVPVPVIRLDDAVDEDLWLLKMDTQGNEAKVLAGATRLFERRTVAHVFTEFTPRLLREAGSQPRQVLEHLRSTSCGLLLL
jgi:FkbM family methyltransferase